MPACSGDVTALSRPTTASARSSRRRPSARRSRPSPHAVEVDLALLGAERVEVREREGPRVDHLAVQRETVPRGERRLEVHDRPRSGTRCTRAVSVMRQRSRPRTSSASGRSPNPNSRKRTAIASANQVEPGAPERAADGLAGTSQRHPQLDGRDHRGRHLVLDQSEHRIRQEPSRKVGAEVQLVPGADDAVELHLRAGEPDVGALLFGARVGASRHRDRDVARQVRAHVDRLLDGERDRLAPRDRERAERQAGARTHIDRPKHRRDRGRCRPTSSRHPLHVAHGHRRTRMFCSRVSTIRPSGATARRRRGGRRASRRAGRAP